MSRVFWWRCWCREAWGWMRAVKPSPAVCPGVLLPLRQQTGVLEQRSLSFCVKVFITVVKTASMWELTVARDPQQCWTLLTLTNWEVHMQIQHAHIHWQSSQRTDCAEIPILSPLHWDQPQTQESLNVLSSPTFW